ncbi:MAG: potassium transporter TrkG [Candidatus Eisenbacteria bacterium]
MTAWIGIGHRDLTRRISRGLLAVGALLGLVSLVLTIGFPEGSPSLKLGRALEIPAAVLFIAEHLLQLTRAADWREALRRRWLGHVLILLLLIETVALLQGGWLSTWIRPRTLMRIYLISLQVFIALGMIRAVIRLNHQLARLRLRPASIAFGIYVIAIMAGAAILLLPAMTTPDRRVSFLDALFTSCSAVCVTGLSTVDIGVHFTRLGQGLIMVLIQMGGLGIMALAAFLAFVSGAGLGIRERQMLGEVLSVDVMRRMSTVVGFIVGSTLLFELAGAFVIFLGLSEMEVSLPGRIFESLFHSIAAFCNAGFSTQSTNLIAFRGNPLVVVPVLLLLVVGGLGFYVLMDLWKASGRFKGRPRRTRLGRRLGVQTKLVLVMTGALLGGGWLLMLALEWNGSLAGLPLGERLLSALFMAATPRTAGFTVTDPLAWTPATVFLLILLMVVGAGSGSTAGGMKVTTLGVMLAAVRSQALARDRTVLFHREVPWRHIQEAVVVITVYLAVLCLGTLGLLITESHGLREVFFEAASALGTVGLSLGITPQLTAAGKVLAILLMLVGRIGPLTLALAVAAPARPPRARYAEARFLVG